MKKTALLSSFIFLLGYMHTAKAQNVGSGEIHGNFQMDAQYYKPDSLIGAPKVPEKMGINGFANIIYSNGNFSAGVRYESYAPPLQGFDPRYNGAGIPFRYATYKIDNLEVTAGSYYEQFGNGLILRSYEERGLGLDNALDGVRLRYNPFAGIYLKGLYGRQRSYFTQGPGLVRGGDMEIQVNDFFKGIASLSSKPHTDSTSAETTGLIPQLTLGMSVVSKFQTDQDPIFVLPENVLAISTRASLIIGKFSLNTEYAYKYNDPSAVNNFIYKNGQAFLMNANYSQKGFGVSLGMKKIDNMDFRSDRTATGNNLSLNFLPPITKQHTYQMLAFYPYATQNLGETGLSGELFYTLKPGSILGGTYGTNITLNASSINGLDSTKTSAYEGYESKAFKFGKSVYFQDFNIEINKKLTKSLKAILTLSHIRYNKGVITGQSYFGTVNANVAVLDITYKLDKRNTIHTELQSLMIGKEEDHGKGNWGMALVEYTFSPHWFVAVFDQYNYGNEDPNLRLHYFNASFGFTKNANRFVIGYGKQREGILCVGGVCRNVPAANGVTLSITSSF